MELPNNYKWIVYGKFAIGIILANRAISIINQDDFPFAANENKAAMIAESRALRAFYYWYIMDNFGDAPLVTEPTSELPDKNIPEGSLWFIVKELKESFSDLPTEKNESNYGRFTLWGAKALLANVYLNAEVYTGDPPMECLYSRVWWYY